MEMKPYIGTNPFTLKAIESMQMTMMKTQKKKKTKSFFLVEIVVTQDTVKL